MVFYVNHIRVKVEFSFLLIIAFSILQNNKSLGYLLLLSSIHEAAHLLVLILFKGKPKELVVAFYGFGLKYEHNFTFISELMFLLSGAAANLLLYSLGICREINGALAFVNLLPLYPIDGGRAIKLILNKLFKLDISDKIYIVISVTGIIFLVLYSVFTKNYSLILICAYTIVYSLNYSFD